MRFFFYLGACFKLPIQQNQKENSQIYLLKVEEDVVVLDVYTIHNGILVLNL